MVSRKAILLSFSRSIVKVMQGSTEFKCSRKVCVLPDFAVVITSSTNLFQNKGGLVSEASALSSRSSMTMFAIIAEMGEPIAVP